MFNLHGKAGGNILGLMFRSASLSLVIDEKLSAPKFESSRPSFYLKTV